MNTIARKKQRAKYLLDYCRARNGVIVGDYVIGKDGLFKSDRNDQGYTWTTFDRAHIYRSKRQADKAAIHLNGAVMLWKETEEETITGTL